MLSSLHALITHTILCSDLKIAFLLRQRKEQVLLRKHQWRTPFVSDHRFDAMTSEAIRFAEGLSGATEPITVNWLCVHLSEAEEDDFHDLVPSPPADDDMCLLGDTLEAMLVEESPNDQENPDAHSENQPFVTSESIPMPDRELLMSDTSPVRLAPERLSSFLSLSYIIQYTARINTTLLLPAVPATMPAVPPETCTIPALPGDPNTRPLTFGSSALNRLNRRDGWLNDQCIDYCSEVLRRHFEAKGPRIKSAIFSVFTISQYLRGYDEALWRTALLTPEFWKKPLWIIPINVEQSHWTVAIVYWNKKRIAYFDSFGSRSAWDRDTTVRLICYFVELSNSGPSACI